jgi:hypothetical protein
MHDIRLPPGLEIFALMGFTQRGLVVSCRCFGTIYLFNFQGSNSQDCSAVGGWNDRLSRNVVNYQYILCNIPEERRPHLEEPTCPTSTLHSGKETLFFNQLITYKLAIVRISPCNKQHFERSEFSPLGTQTFQLTYFTLIATSRLQCVRTWRLFIFVSEHCMTSFKPTEESRSKSC